MAGTNINRVILTGNLTRDPELRAAGSSGLQVCSLRIAVNTRRKDNTSGQWVEDPNFFDITVFGAQGENCARFLSKGRPIAVDGRLRWREWTNEQSGEKRQAVEIIADSVQFLGGRDDSGGGGYSAPQSDVPVNTSDFAPPQPQPQPQPAAVANGNAAPADDDIPF